MVVSEGQTAEIQSIELRIVELLQQDRYRWQELAQLALRVRREKLYVERGLHSFTAWIKAIAEAANRQPSLFWRYLKAAVYYLRQVESDDIDRIAEIKAAPEALDRLEKIERQAPRPVFEAMRDKVLAGAATVLECRQLEKQYRPDDGSHNRGRPVRALEGSYTYLGQWKKDETQAPVPAAAPEAELRRGSHQTGTALKGLLETHALTWSRDCAGQPYVARNHAFYQNITVSYATGSSVVEATLQALVVARWTLEKPKDLLGIATVSCIADFDTQHHWDLYLRLCQYFSLAIPEHDRALQDLLHQTLPQPIGILTADLARIETLAETTLSILRKPQRTRAELAGHVYETLYDTAMGWKKL